MPTVSSNQFTAPARPSTGEPLDLPLLDTSKVTYQGSFRLPNSDDLAYGVRLGGIAYNPDNDSIFVCGRREIGGGGQAKNNETVAEFSIPTPVQTTSWGSLPVGSQLQPWVYAADGKQPQITQGQNGNAITGMQVYDGKLFISVVSMYLPTGSQNACGFYRDSLNLSTGNVTGPFTVGSGIPQRGAGLGLGGLVPDNWKATFGGNPMIWGGGGGASTVGNQYCNGPGMIFCDPDNFSQATRAAFYPDPEDIGIDSTAPFSATWTWMSEARATIMLPESRTILAFGLHAGNQYVGGYQQAVDKARSRFWLYDAQDVKDGFDGTVSYRNVVPYGSIDFSHGGTSVPFREEEFNRGGTWDATGRRLIESIGKVNSSYPLFNVYHIAE